MNKTEHLGERHPKTWKGGATCDSCQANSTQARADVWRGSPLIGTVPGGSKDTAEHRMHMDFDKDMDAYSDAKAEGLQPTSTTRAGVKKAQAQVKSHEAALRDASKVGIEFPENIKVAPGVDKEKYFKELV